MRPRFLGFLVLLSSLTAAAQPNVAINLRPPSEMDEQLRSVWTAKIINLTGAPIEDLDYYFSAGTSTIVTAPERCTTEFASKARCTIDLPANGSQDVAFTTQNSAAFGHFSAVMESVAGGALRYDEAVFGREFPVETTADAGPGSLRQAIADINEACVHGVPCIVTFRLDEGRTEDGIWFINLLSPLPEITAPDVFLDGGSQIRHTGSTLGRPLVVVNGAAAGEAHGLVFRNGTARVTDLSISRFSGNGIEIRAGMAMIMRNFLVLNGSRGVVLVDGYGYVTDNVLSSNARSGGFFWTSKWVKVLRNFVDHNRASGLFFHKPAISRDFAEAKENNVRNNVHAGIALSVAATGDFAENSFRDNVGLPIDIGLDGPTTATVPGFAGRGAIMGAPSIVAARFADGLTRITVRMAPHPAFVSSFRRVAIYSGGGNAQSLIRVVDVRAEEFTVEVAADLRGQSVYAAMVANTIENFDDAMIGTSEMGESRVVE